MSKSYQKRLAPLATALGVVACGLLEVEAGPAWAGTNGQQINYYSHYAYVQCTTGTNQYGNSTQSCTQLRIGSTLHRGYWWVGPVNVTWYRPGRIEIPSACSVPKMQDADFVTCHEPS
jgi:hypothetical protein